VPARLDVMLGLISAAMAIKGAFRLLAMQQVGYTVAQVANDLRKEVIGSVLATRWSYFVHQPLGRFANVVGAEVMRAATAYQHVCSLLAVSVHVAMLAALAFLISPEIALLALTSGAIILVVHTPFVRRARAAGRMQNDLLRSISVRLTDVLAGIKPLKAMGRERQLGPVLEREVSALGRAQERQVLAVEAVGATREPLVVALLSVVLYVSLTATSQSFASLLLVAVLFVRIAARVSQAQGHYQETAIGESAYRSTRESIALAVREREPRPGRLTPPEVEVGVELRAVTFRHGDQAVLDEASLFVPSRGFVALVGRSGKTTVADLIVGLHCPTSGAVLVGGVSLERIDLAAWREKIGYVPQDAFLFHDTVLDNVAMGDPAVSRDDVLRALDAAGARDFVSRLPAGENTVIGERGGRLSGGQRQRIAIARALVRRPRLLILDEATASLDPATEREICDTLRRLREEVAVVAISHRLAVADAADVVYRLECGRVHTVTGALC
jgi:ATP-binding cassette, subfamily C, bacterial